MTKAIQAETQANNAYDTATAAQNAAEVANTQAGTAQSAAMAAEQSASQSLTAAQAAEQTANEAKTVAETTAVDMQQFRNITETALIGKVDKVTGKGLSTEDYTATEKAKLAGIAANANNYTHPVTHPPAIIVQDANNRFMTDAERTKLTGINKWNEKEIARIERIINNYPRKILGGLSAKTVLTKELNINTKLFSQSATI